MATGPQTQQQSPATERFRTSFIKKRPGVNFACARMLLRLSTQHIWKASHEGLLCTKSGELFHRLESSKRPCLKHQSDQGWTSPIARRGH
eukprot:4161034-Amphidinium_carterae.1